MHKNRLKRLEGLFKGSGAEMIIIECFNEDDTGARELTERISIDPSTGKSTVLYDKYGEMSSGARVVPGKKESGVWWGDI